MACPVSRDQPYVSFVSPDFSETGPSPVACHGSYNCPWFCAVLQERLSGAWRLECLNPAAGGAMPLCAKEKSLDSWPQLFFLLGTFFTSLRLDSLTSLQSSERSFAWIISQVSYYLLVCYYTFIQVSRMSEGRTVTRRTLSGGIHVTWCYNYSGCLSPSSGPGFRGLQISTK